MHNDVDSTAELRRERESLFAKLADPATIPAFFERVAPDVTWTVEGTHPLAGTFTDKSEFVEATFGRLGRLMRDRVRLRLDRLIVDGDLVVAELQADSTTLEGAPYDNRLCWVCRFSGPGPDDRIVEVHAYLDSAMVSWTVERNERHGEGARE